MNAHTVNLELGPVVHAQLPSPKDRIRSVYCLPNELKNNMMFDTKLKAKKQLSLGKRKRIKNSIPVPLLIQGDIMIVGTRTPSRLK